MKQYLPDGISREKRTAILNADMRASIPSICLERARLITESYKQTQGQSYLLRRARGLAHILEHMTIFIRPEELIVGNHASNQRYAPLFPETGSMSARELDLMPVREVDTLQISEAQKKELLEDIYPWWKGQSLEDIALSRFPEDLKAVIQAPHGVFDCFSRARSGYGHYLPNIERIMHEGFCALEDEAKARLARLTDGLPGNCADNKDFGPRESQESPGPGTGRSQQATPLGKKAYYESVIIICQAVRHFARRYALLARSMASECEDPRRAKELLLIGEACDHVPYYPARNFHEALQCYWFTLLIDFIFQNGSAISSGRFDQYVYPFYISDLECGRITRDEAQELIEALWIKHNDVIKACTYNSARNNGGFSTSIHMTLGGIDQNGENACNDLTFLCLEADQNVFNCEPNIGIRVNRKNPLELPKKVFDILARNGGGKYPIFNDSIILEALLKDGMAKEDAYNYGIVGCVEPNAYGNSLSISNACYFNLAKCLELALTNGKDLLSGQQLGLPTGNAADFTSFEDVLQAFRKQTAYFVEKMCDCLNIIEATIAEVTPHIYCSLLLDDCMEHGLDSAAGGSRYNYCGVQGVGSPDVADALMAIKKLVFDEKKITMPQLLEALEHDFEGYEQIQQMLLYDAPKYGNDIDEVDELVRDTAEFYCIEVGKHPEWRGGKFRPGLYCVSANTPIGRNVGAMASGRKSKTPLADGGISPKQGADTNGPTAVFLSASKYRLDLVTNGVDLNMKLLPSLAKTDEDRKKLAQMVRGYFAAGGMHVQFNVISDEILRRAQKHPAQYRNLVVRVAGYSAFFVDLDTEIQNEIISRTAMNKIG